MEYCKGCLIKCTYYYSYHHQENITPEATMIKIMKCPCVTCLVKVVCNVGCDDYTIFSNKIISRRIQKMTYGAVKRK